MITCACILLYSTQLHEVLQQSHIMPLHSLHLKETTAVIDAMRPSNAIVALCTHTSRDPQILELPMPEAILEMLCCLSDEMPSLWHCILGCDILAHFLGRLAANKLKPSNLTQQKMTELLI